MDRMKNLKELVIEFGGAFGNAVAESTKDDGEITWGDGLKFFPVIAKLPAAVAGMDQIDDEIASMTPADFEELHKEFAAKWGEALSPDDLDTVIGFCRHAVALVAMFRERGAWKN